MYLVYISASVNVWLAKRRDFLPFPLCLVLKILSSHLLMARLRRSLSVVHGSSSSVIVLLKLHSQRSCQNQPIFDISISEFSLCTFKALLSLTRDGLVSAEGCSGLPRIWDSRMPVLLLSAVPETLEIMGVMIVLYDFGFDMSLGDFANCRSHDVDWPWCMPSWFPYNLNMGEVSDVLWCRASCTRRHNADGEPIND